MVFMMLDPRQKKSGSTLENVAEEMLNGLFCHYEPPTSEYAQHKAATELKANPNKYVSTPTARSKKSILRTSRLFRKKVTPKAAATAPAPAKKGVTWRDEQTQPGIEGRVVACAIDQCDFFGISTRVGGGLADSLSPTAGTANPFPEPAVYQETRSAENEAAPQVEESRDEEAAAEPAGKVLYDDEGNPISINTDSDPTSDALAAMDEFEDAPRTARKAATEEVAQEEEEAYHHRSTVPSGYSQVRKLAMQFERGEMYEPLNYDKPKQTAQSLAYRRVRSPPVHRSSTPRGGVYEYDNEEVDLAAPSGLTSVQGRPSTPYRRRGNDDAGRDREGRMGFESPARRSDVYSDLTMDDALTGRGRYYRFPQSPAKPSEGIEVDMYRGRARPHSKSPSHYRSQTPKDHYAPFPQAHSRIRDERVGMSALADDASREPMEDDEYVEDVTPAVNTSRRHSTSEYDGHGTRVEQRPIKIDRLRRVSAPLPGMQGQNRSANPVDAVIRELEHKVRLRSTMTKVSEAIKELESKNRKKYDPKRPVPPPKRTPAVAAPAPSRRNRDPTPRRSLEPSMEDKRPQGLLPPTPRRKDEGRRDTFESRGAEVPSKPTTTATTGYNKSYSSAYNKSYSKPEQKSEYPRPAHSHSRPTPIEDSKVEAGTYEKTVRQYRQPFSPSSVATDQEIRAEVTSIGVTDTPKAFSRFSTPYQIPATVTDDSAERENSQPNKSSRKRDKKGDIVPAESAGSGSARKKLVKGFKKAVGKMKEIVKDIDDSRIDLDPHHPGHAKQGSSKSKRSHSTKRSAKRQ
eukprot:Nitzschia sp. Nitz4//scaffold89_size161592//52275//54668//NITZ4_002372-RA/size161592-processed-gene-0.219-mRNA-1//-1//CDS//3329559598//5903//frame0